MNAALRELLGAAVAWWTLAPGHAGFAQEVSRHEANGGRKPPVVVPVPTIGTLRPTFEWTAPEGSGLKYDLVVCVGVLESNGFWGPGPTVYHREGLDKPKHTVEEPLSPDTVYVWSVRARSGRLASKWAEYRDMNSPPDADGRHRHNKLWPFKTPPK